MCTLFVLLLCLTGLPLIFHHEIDHWLGTAVKPPAVTAGSRATLDEVMHAARARYPDRTVQFMSQEPDDDRLWFVTLAHSPEATEDFKSIAVDARTAQVVAEPKTDEGFMHTMFRLHVDLFAGLPGKLLLGFMGLLLLVAIVSGVVLYAPFMRKLDFGSVRRDRSPRVRWLDLHNLLGIVTLAWALVVGATGVVNAWGDLLVKYWQFSELSGMLAPYQGRPLVDEARRAPAQHGLDAALARQPGMGVAFIAFPGTVYSSPHHTTFFLRGDAPLTSRLLQPVLVDAATAQVTAAPQLPWYLAALLLSQPLHFGDYGGLPMKFLWALLDLTTIAVLVSGLLLWLKRRGLSRADADLRGAPISMPAR